MTSQPLILEVEQLSPRLPAVPTYSICVDSCAAPTPAQILAVLQAIGKRVTSGGRADVVLDVTSRRDVVGGSWTATLKLGPWRPSGRGEAYDDKIYPVFGTLAEVVALLRAVADAEVTPEEAAKRIDDFFGV